jgi:hypothetical protein
MKKNTTKKRAKMMNLIKKNMVFMPRLVGFGTIR